MSGNPMSENKPVNALAIGIAVSLVIATVCGGIYFLVWKGPKEVVGATTDGAIQVANSGYDLLKRAGGDLYRALRFEPKVVIGSETVHGPATQITEIATASKDFGHTYFYEANWAGSTKRLRLKGDFTAKAGFPVDDTFTMKISEDGSKVTLRHKQPQLLSCEMTKLHVLQDEDGWWNKLQAKEREAAQNELLRQARELALDADLRETATRNLLDRLAPLRSTYSFETDSEIVP
jgi:Protein of unknown function (DUF4230)